MLSYQQHDCEVLVIVYKNIVSTIDVNCYYAGPDGDSCNHGN